MDHFIRQNNVACPEDEVTKLIDVLVGPKVKIITMGRFTIVFDSPPTVNTFVEKWSLSENQAELLRECVFRMQGADDADVSWKVWRSQVRENRVCRVVESTPEEVDVEHLMKSQFPWQLHQH